MNQLHLVSTVFGALNVAAAIDQGLYGTAGPDRTLLVSTNAEIPESASNLISRLDELGFSDRFDRVVNWNECIAPFHPNTFRSIGEPAVTSQWLRSQMGLPSGPIELNVESIQVPPARTLAALFLDAPITVYSDGLMSYGPTRFSLPIPTGERIERLVHLDLMPGVQPILLGEFEVPVQAIDDDAFRTQLDAVALSSSDAQIVAAVGDLPRPWAMILGQYLAPLGIVSFEEEQATASTTIERLAAAGYRAVVFKPHPTAPWSTFDSLERTAAEAGVVLKVAHRTHPFELLMASAQPDLVVSCFSTGLAIASRFYGAPVATFGTEPVLRALTPYENSNRVPLTIVDATVPHLGERGVLQPTFDLDTAAGRADSQSLIRAVGYTMQPQLRSDLRQPTLRWLKSVGPAQVDRWFERSRLGALGLPGAPPTRARRIKTAVWRVSDSSRRTVRSSPPIARAARNTRRVLTPMWDRATRSSGTAQRVSRAIGSDDAR
ncbi:MAG: polysialyltransferase family glycosyltransferase [Actinomycetota bacterium]